jgi:hypothetical protein
MRKKTGFLSSFALNYDLVFLSLIRLTTGEDHIRICPHRCIAHPTCKKSVVVDNPATDYAARVLALLSYHKFLDDARDEKGFARLFARIGAFFFKRARRLSDLAHLDERIAEHLGRLSQLEKDKVASIDAPAEIFGDLLGEIFAEGAPLQESKRLFGIGKMLGKFIYCADAAEDYESDRKKHRYNPYVLSYSVWGKEEKLAVRDSLICLLAEGESLWQGLPLADAVQVRHLIENVMYEGLLHRLDFLLDSPVPKPKKRKIRPYEGVLP